MRVLSDHGSRHAVAATLYFAVLAGSAFSSNDVFPGEKRSARKAAAVAVGGQASARRAAARDTASEKARARKARTKELYGIQWHASLPAALRTAHHTEDTPRKPVFCLRVLGDLAGLM